MEFETILFDIDARGVVTLTLNRPQKHNAINSEMIDDIMRAVDHINAMDNVRVVVLRGSGQTFCAGGDLAWMQEQARKDRAGKKQEAHKLATMLAKLDDLPVPLLARVHGAAYGAGVGLMCVSDVVFSAVDAKFGLTETKLGLIPATIGPFVVRRVGEGFARRIYFTGSSFDVDFAMRCSAVSHACDESELDVLVNKEIAKIMTCAPGATAIAKAQCRTFYGNAASSFIDDSVELLADRWESDEVRDGIHAFFEKSVPAWVR